MRRLLIFVLFSIQLPAQNKYWVDTQILRKDLEARSDIAFYNVKNEFDSIIYSVAKSISNDMVITSAVDFNSGIPNSKFLFNIEMESNSTIAAANCFGSDIILVSSVLPVIQERKWFCYDLYIKTFNLAGEILKNVKLPDGDFESVKIIHQNKNIHIILDGQELNID
jgi:hypothetical protein